MRRNRLAFWTALAGAAMLAANAEAAFISYGITTISQQSVAQPFSFSFGIVASGTVNFGEHSLSLTLTDNNRDGASLTATSAVAELNGVNIGLDFTFDCAAPATGSNTCSASLSTPFAPTVASTMEVTVQFTLTGFDTVSVAGEYEVSLVDTPVPEPGTLALLGGGLAALGFARRRRTG